jgi:hypothetical protein
MAKKFSQSGHAFPAKFGFKQSAGAVGVKGHLRAAPKPAPKPAPMAAPSGAGAYPAGVATVAAGLNKPGAVAASTAPAVPRAERGAPRDMAGFAKGGSVKCKY